MPSVGDGPLVRVQTVELLGKNSSEFEFSFE